MKARILFACTLLFAFSQPAFADFDFDRNNSMLMLVLRTDVDDDLDLTKLEITLDDDELVFRIEEYAGGELVDVETRDFDASDFISVVVLSGADCALHATNFVPNKTIYFHGSDLADRLIDGTFMFGELGNDYVCGGQSCEGGGDDDLMVDCRFAEGDEGDDILHAIDDATGSYLFGGAGQDWLIGNRGDDYLHAGSGDDFVFGGTGNDKLFGDSGFDVCYGGDGNDRMDGGSSNHRVDTNTRPAESGEILNGQGGADVFVRYTVSGNVVETWNDFKASRGDRWLDHNVNSSWFIFNYYSGYNSYSLGY